MPLPTCEGGLHFKFEVNPLKTVACRSWTTRSRRGHQISHVRFCYPMPPKKDEVRGHFLSFLVIKTEIENSAMKQETDTHKEEHHLSDMKYILPTVE